MRTIGKIGFYLLVLAVILLFGVVAFSSKEARADTPATLYTHLKLTWTPVTIDVSGAALAVPVTAYDVYCDTAPIPDAPTAAPSAIVASPVVVANIYPTVLAGSTLYCRVDARNGTDAAHTSQLSGQVSVATGQVVVVPPTQPVVAPAKPAGVTIGISYTTTPPSG